MSDEPKDNSVSKLYAEIQKRKERHRGTIAELTSVKLELEKSNSEKEALKKDLDGLKNSPNDLKEKLEKAEKGLREMKHKGIFNKVANHLKVREDALEDVYKLSGYSPDAEEPDEKSITEFLSKFVESKKFYLEEEVKAPVKLVPSPGSARGIAPQISGNYRITKSDQREITKNRNHPKRAEYMESLKLGTLEVIEG